MTDASLFEPVKAGAEDKPVDVAMLEKRLVDKDQYIKQLQDEQARAREDLNLQSRLDQVLEQLKSPIKVDTPPPQRDSNEPDPQRIETLVDAAVTRKAVDDRRKENIAVCVSTLKEAFGSEYETKLKEQMDRLKLDATDMNALAAKSPAAFIELFNVKKAPQVDVGFVPPRNQVNPETFKPNSGEKTWATFEQMRRSADPKIRQQYWTQAVQNELHRKSFEYAEKGLDFTTTK